MYVQQKLEKSEASSSLFLLASSSLTCFQRTEAEMCATHFILSQIEVMKRNYVPIEVVQVKHQKGNENTKFQRVQTPRDEVPTFIKTCKLPQAFGTLPTETVLCILEFFHPRDLFKVKLLCKSWKYWMDRDQFWKDIIRLSFKCTIKNSKQSWEEFYKVLYFKSSNKHQEWLAFSILKEENKYLIWSGLSLEEKKELIQEAPQSDGENFLEGMEFYDKLDFIKSMEAYTHLITRKTLEEILDYLDESTLDNIIFWRLDLFSDFLPILKRAKDKIMKSEAFLTELYERDLGLEFWREGDCAEKAKLLEIWDEEYREDFWNDLEEDERADVWPLLSLPLQRALTPPLVHTPSVHVSKYSLEFQLYFCFTYSQSM